MGPYTIVGLDLSTSLGVSVPTVLSSPTLTLIGTSPPYATNEVYLFGTNQSGAYFAFVSLYAGPSGSQELIIPNGGFGNANPQSFATRFLLNSVIPPNTEIWATGICYNGTSGTINVSVGLSYYSKQKKKRSPVQFLGNATPPGTGLTSGATANTMGAWVELGTITYKSDTLLLMNAPGGYPNSGILFIGIGTAPSEALLTIPFNAEGSNTMQMILAVHVDLFPGMVLSAAYQTTGTSQATNLIANAY